MLSINVLQYNVNTTIMEVLAWKDGQSYSMVKTFGFTTFHLTDFLGMQFQQWSSNSKHKPCVITWLTVHRQSPYRWSRAMQVHYKRIAEFQKICALPCEANYTLIECDVTVQWRDSRHSALQLHHQEGNQNPTSIHTSYH